MLSKKAKIEESALELIEQQLNDVSKEPTDFLQAQPKLYAQINQLIQTTYKATTKEDEINRKCKDFLQELVVEDMDEEQIWQQIELRNDLVLQQVLLQTSKILALNEQKLEIRLNESGDEDTDNEQLTFNENDSEGDMEEQVTDEDIFEGKRDDDTKESQTQNKKKYRSTIVDDTFFKLREMEEFLEAEDAKEMRKQNNQKQNSAIEDGIDYFAEDLGDENAMEEEEVEEVNAHYADFFANEDSTTKVKKQKDYFADSENDDELQANESMQNVETEELFKNSIDEKENEEDEDENEDDEENEDELLNDNDNKGLTRNIEPATMSSDSDSSDSGDDEDDEKPKSSYEIRQARLDQRIKEYEEEILGEKPWQLKGEIQAASRPQNSLLEEVLEFESTTRPAPVVTEQTTLSLEDIIRQRIKDKAWDDPVRMVAPIKTPHDFRKQIILDQEKSKESLAHIYEKEYQRELDKLNPNQNDDNAEEEPKAHKEIRSKLNALFTKLDALSNYHFTPKPALPEGTIITNTPAIEMEEVAPVAVSDANLLAPEEVYGGPKHDLLGKTERTRTDKNRDRRKKKQKQRFIHKALEAKDEQRRKLGIPLTKKAENAKLLKSITKNRNVEKLIASGDQKALKSSKAFFSKLQDTTTNATMKATKKKADSKSLSAKKLKL